MYHRAKLHFKKADPALYQVAKLHKIADIRRSGDVFGDLIHAIVNQQLSGKAADTIYGRLEALVSGKGKVRHRKEWGKRMQSALTPQAILKLSASSMRTCG